MILEKYSWGIGDRFAHQGEAQLKAIMEAQKLGLEITPVWNKSNREHTIVHSSPEGTRKEADNAVKALGWKGSYRVDADHINLSTVDHFIDNSDFFTLDVADYIGKKANDESIKKFIEKSKTYEGKLSIPGIAEAFDVTPSLILAIAEKFCYAIEEAHKIYKKIEASKGKDNFITEVSMDEVDQPQTPVELFFILCGLAQVGVPLQTIAPKFTGRFNKGVDYRGDIQQFSKEFEEDVLVIDFAVKEFGLAENLKLSIHSGSDKFSIYPIMGQIIKKYNKGIHVKTAGTTWLEEVIGLAVAGGKGLDVAKEIYCNAYGRMDELCGPYATVIDIHKENLPAPETVKAWDSKKFANSLRHIPGHPDYNSDLRQLIHVGYKVAAELGNRYTDELVNNKEIVGQCVTENLLERHIKRLFV